MARWDPDARGRLEKAAMELFRERGYDRTTVEDVARRAGLTERTFFRYFADKREVLFSGAKELEQLIVDGVANAPAEARPLAAVVSAIERACTHLEERRDIEFARARYDLIVKHAEVQERELIKLAALSSAITGALRARGVDEPAASLAAQMGMGIFKVAFERWIAEKKPQGLAAHVRPTLAALRAVSAEREGAKPEGAEPKKTPAARGRKPTSGRS
ncbi:MAG TPA: TetR family transcriptional regulator, partial [Polyangiaceae bacterium]|nr:TetR family transcriptional regulator [Polyangiaceae bacterium]